MFISLKISLFKVMKIKIFQINAELIDSKTKEEIEIYVNLTTTIYAVYNGVDGYVPVLIILDYYASPIKI